MQFLSGKGLPIGQQFAVEHPYGSVESYVLDAQDMRIVQEAISNCLIVWTVNTRLALVVKHQHDIMDVITIADDTNHYYYRLDQRTSQLMCDWQPSNNEKVLYDDPQEILLSYIAEGKHILDNRQNNMEKENTQKVLYDDLFSGTI